MGEYVLIFLTSLAGSAHCVGMCGPFVLGLSAGKVTPRLAASLFHQVVYHLGKLFTYLFLGALLGALGSVATTYPPLSKIQLGLGIIAGLLMLLIGLQNLGVLKKSMTPRKIIHSDWLQPILTYWYRAKGASSAFYLGLFAGFLPCPMVYAFSAKAASAGTVNTGILTMLAFGLGTIPILLVVAIAGAVLNISLRQRIFQISGALLILLAMVTLIRVLFPDFVLFGGGQHHYHHL